jgi:hypothetical protein
MWVLEARKDAEKVWYPVVWEEIKDASNVIDYDIREEQTKDISAEINANNQTTTGMANVIPWVNAPKLLESTSIISAPRPWYIQATFNWSWDAAHEPWWQQMIWNYVISDEIWTPKFTVTWTRISIPADWIYQIAITYPEDWSFHYRVTRIYDTNPSWRFVNHTGNTWSLHRDTETIVHEFKKWATLYAIVEYYYVWSGSWGWRNPQLTMTVTRLW